MPSAGMHNIAVSAPTTLIAQASAFADAAAIVAASMVSVSFYCHAFIRANREPSAWSFTKRQ